MTPATLNKRIRAGETFWAKWEKAKPLGEAEVLAAKSVKGKCRVRIKTYFKAHGGKPWIDCSAVRLWQSEQWIPLTAKGRMDWAIN